MLHSGSWSGRSLLGDVSHHPLAPTSHRHARAPSSRKRMPMPRSRGEGMLVVLGGSGPHAGEVQALCAGAAPSGADTHALRGATLAPQQPPTDRSPHDRTHTYTYPVIRALPLALCPALPPAAQARLGPWPHQAGAGGRHLRRSPSPYSTRLLTRPVSLSQLTRPAPSIRNAMQVVVLLPK